MVKKLPIIREIFKGDHNAAAAVRKLTQDVVLEMLFTQTRTHTQMPQSDAIISAD